MNLQVEGNEPCQLEVACLGHILQSAADICLSLVAIMTAFVNISLSGISGTASPSTGRPGAPPSNCFAGQPTCNHDSPDQVVVSSFREPALRLHWDRLGGSTEQQQRLNDARAAWDDERRSGQTLGRAPKLAEMTLFLCFPVLFSLLVGFPK